MTNFISMSECRTLPPGIDEIANLTITDNAAKAHDEIFTWLYDHGWQGTKEAPMAYDMDDKTHHGRIDIVVEKGDYRLAIEIDRKTPHKKSVEKLNNFHGYTLLLCRNNDKASVIQVFQRD